MWGGASADAIIIRTPAGVSPLIFSDPTSTTRTVTSTATSDPVGGPICTGGAVSKEVCRVEIDATGQTVRYDNHIVYNLVKAHQADAVPVFARGNSGGPVYTSIGSSGAQARGIVSAFQYVDGIARYNLGWYSSMRYITPELGVTVKTP